jgi:hypothetical protein
MRRGDSGILEVPISSAIVPFIGTTMRVSPTVKKVLQRYIFYEAMKTEKPVVFLFHPNECVDINEKVTITRRAEGTLEYIFADVIRQRLKLRNLGNASLKLLDETLRDAKEYGFEFVSVKEYKNVSFKW